MRPLRYPVPLAQRMWFIIRDDLLIVKSVLSETWHPIFILFKFPYLMFWGFYPRVDSGSFSIQEGRKEEHKYNIVPDNSSLGVSQ